MTVLTEFCRLENRINFSGKHDVVFVTSGHTIFITWRYATE